VKSEFPIPKWTEKHGVIRFSVVSDGTTGEAWIARLESKGFYLGVEAKSILRSKSFKTTSGITYEVAILKGEIFSDNERVTKNIYEEAKNRKLSTPFPEVACLIREKFSDKELEAMGLFWIFTMHEPIEYFCVPKILVANRRDCGSRLITETCFCPATEWACDGGFAFVVSH